MAPTSTRDMSDLPEWARQALAEGPGASSRPLTGDDLRKEPSWPLLLDAAVVSSFLPKDLAPRAMQESQRRDAENFVLGYSQITATQAGTKWELTRSARAAVLDAAVRSNEIDAAVRRTQERFTDSLSSALRDTLVGQSSAHGVDDVALATLEARRAATALVKNVEGLKLPALGEFDRNIRRRRMIDQFERMCGKDFARRIVGRDKELEDLRAYVGSVPSGSLLAAGARLFDKARAQIMGRDPYVLWGTGGVGKTTLISRFMLEHVRAAERNFPFAYLDFDRPSVSASDPVGLLSEICLQVAAQFEELDEKLRGLREEILSLQSREQGSDYDSITLLAVHARMFCVHLEQFLKTQESFLEWQRPFLLVFDTFEIAQYDTEQVEVLERFVGLFTIPERDTGRWRRLRLIISGRRRVESFTESVEVHELDGLDLKGATELLVRLAAEVGKPIAKKNASAVVAALAIRNHKKELRVHPLRAHMAAQVISKSESRDGNALADALAAELTSGMSGAKGVASSLVEGILVRRIIKHVRDERVRALADPGLVVRRITPEMIRFVMAPSTPKPGTEAERWEIDQAEAEAIFRAFQKELTLVEPDGRALRHRQDVRSQMLPLIRARNSKAFRQVHLLAFDYLQRQARTGDTEAAVEAIYHGLWIDVPFEEIDALWALPGVGSPRIDPEEFPPDSKAAVYLKARSRERLTVAEVKRLPPSTAGQWAMDFGNRFLLTRNPVQTLAVLRAATGERLERLQYKPDMALTAGRLLYRAGMWRESRVLIEVSKLHEQTLDGDRSPFGRLAATLAARSGAQQHELKTIADNGNVIWDALAQAEVFGHLAIGLARVGEHAHDFSVAAADAAQRVALAKWWGARRILKLVLMAGNEPDSKLVAAWMLRWDRLPRDPECRPLLEHLLQDLHQRASGPNSGARSDLFPGMLVTSGDVQRTFDAADRGWKRDRERFVEIANQDRYLRTRVRILAAFDHTDWHGVITFSLSRALEINGGQLRHRLVEHNFMRPGSTQSAQSTITSAIGSGRFLELVRMLSAEPDIDESGSAGLTFLNDGVMLDTTIYPQSVGGIARALLGWHETLLKLVEK